MLETYQAWGTYDDSAIVTREVIQEVADEVIGTRQVPLPDGTIYDVDGEWPSIQMYPSLSEALGEEITPDTSLEYLLAIADRLEIEIPRDRGYGHGKLVEELWEHTVGDTLWAPTFVKDFPVETTPLTRQHRSIPGVTEKWDLYVRGIELATGYSELVDPMVQRERFEAQARAAAAGDDEAMALDEDFLAAMEYAMPPTTGTGMGIDRLLMVLTGLSIRETVLFPIVRRHGLKCTDPILVECRSPMWQIGGTVVIGRPTHRLLAQAEGFSEAMAKKVTVTLVDDFDGEGAADETVEFALDGVSYEIDLSSKNAQKLRNDLKQWVEAGRRVGGRRRGRSGSGRPRPCVDRPGAERRDSRLGAPQRAQGVDAGTHPGRHHRRLPRRDVAPHRAFSPSDSSWPPQTYASSPVRLRRSRCR